MSMISGAAFSPLDGIFIVALIVLAVVAALKNHRLKSEERELEEKLAAFNSRLAEMEGQKGTERMS